MIIAYGVHHIEMLRNIDKYSYCLKSFWENSTNGTFMLLNIMDTKSLNFG